MDIDIITQYILTLTPAVTAIISVIVALGVGIGKIKKANKETVEEVKATNKELKARQSKIEETNLNLAQENITLKKDLRQLMAKIQHIHFTEEKEDE